MMCSGAIDDFELRESGTELFVRIWPPRNHFGPHLRKQIAALLPDNIGEMHVTIVEEELSSVGQYAALAPQT